MLETDQAAAPHQRGNGFADLLASFTGRLQNDGWDDSALADDVSTISYEEALRSARRARGANMADGGLASQEISAGKVSGGIKPKRPDRSEKKGKGASITIRVTAEEHAQLHARSSSAGISVSAYLRSCIFDAEALRAEVKQAVARIESAQTANLPERQGRRWRWARYLCSAWRPNRTAQE